MEALSLSRLPKFSVNGSIHLIVNNQLGFTTTAKNGRSTTYASDVAKMVDAPIMHVNADYPEHVARTMALAMAYRATFKKDVVLDLIGFRRHGHNELDEPSFTQPLLYKWINGRPTGPQLYAARLMQEGTLTASEIEEIQSKAFERFDCAVQKSKDYKPAIFSLQQKWPGDKGEGSCCPTGYEPARLIEIAKTSVNIPSGFAIHPRLQKHHVEGRLEAVQKNEIDWATAEAMSIGSLLADGYGVRLCGQDVGRGTFSQRHFELYDQRTEEIYTPLASISPRIEVVNSNLSELGVLGFEYGLSITSARTLPIWEAQFGDFFNGAQVIIDAFVASGETKWGLQSALTIVLPHGYDGTGPEHSSCRIERWLQLTNAPLSPKQGSDANLRFINPSTPANYFHALRRQMLGGRKKPLVVVGPKTLLRLPAAVSRLEEISPGTTYMPIIDDSAT